MTTTATTTAATQALRDLVSARGPFASVCLPPEAGEPDWPVLRRTLACQEIAPEVLDALDEALGRGGPGEGRALIANRSGVLVDSALAWSPPARVARVSDLPYVLPLVPRHTVRCPDSTAGDAGRTVFDQFMFESARPEGPVVQGLRKCAAALRDHNTDALVLTEGALADRTVWVGGTHRDLVAEDEGDLRALGMPVNRQRADEALPMAALTVGAEVLVAPADLPLTDGVGVLLRHP